MERININRRKDPFVRVDRKLAQDEQISFAARGMMAYALSLPPGWKLNLSDLSNRSPQGKSAVRSMMNELMEFGYVTRKRVRGVAGKMAGYDYTIHEQPTVVRFPDDGLTDDGLPDDGEPHTNIEDNVEKKHKDKKQGVVREGSACETESEMIDRILPNAICPANASPQKSSAKKVPHEDGPVTTETAKKREAMIRTMRGGAAPVVADEAKTAPALPTIEEATEAIMAEIETEAGQRKLKFAAGRAGIKKMPANIFAAVARYAEHQKERGHSIHEDPIYKLGGYLKREASKEAQQAETKKYYADKRSTPFPRSRQSPKPVITREQSVRVAESILARRAAERAAAEQ